MRKLPVVTPQNYYDPALAMAYMGASQFKSFMDCEARTLAELRGEWQREATIALLVGSYVDAYFSGEMDAFLEQHPDIRTRDGSLRAEYRQADTIISRILRDPLFIEMLDGRAQVISTGAIAGVPFKVKVDSLLSIDHCAAIATRYPSLAPMLLFAEGAIVDLKIMRDFAPIWKAGQGRVSFVEAWRYDLQLAIYQEVMGSSLPCFIAAATKEAEPDIQLFHIPQEEMDAQLMTVQELAPRFHRIKQGKIEPDRCEACAYCRSKKVLTGSVDYRFETEEVI